MKTFIHILLIYIYVVCTYALSFWWESIKSECNVYLSVLLWLTASDYIFKLFLPFTALRRTLILWQHIVSGHLLFFVFFKYYFVTCSFYVKPTGCNSVWAMKHCPILSIMLYLLCWNLNIELTLCCVCSCILILIVNSLSSWN